MPIPGNLEQSDCSHGVKAKSKQSQSKGFVATVSGKGFVATVSKQSQGKVKARGG